MTEQVYHGIVQNGQVILVGNGKPLAEGTEVLVTPAETQRGTASAVLAALACSPAVPPEWIDELESLIEQGKRQPTRENPFSQDTAENG